MINRILIAVVVCVGSIAIAESTSQAGDCNYRHARAYRPARVYRSAYAYRAPVVVARPAYGYGYGIPTYRYVSPSYRAYSPYRGSYIGPGIGIGYGGYGGYRGYGYGRSGISIGIGF